MIGCLEPSTLKEVATSLPGSLAQKEAEQFQTTQEH